MRGYRQAAFISLSIALLTTGCASNQTTPPVVDVGTQAPIERESQAPAEADQIPPPTTNQATASLLAAAEDAERAADYTNAITYLERAVRIAPRDAALWIRLSRVHLRDANLATAEQHARKAITLAGTTRDLERAAWLQLADVREALGFEQEAQSLRRRYR